MGGYIKNLFIKIFSPVIQPIIQSLEEGIPASEHNDLINKIQQNSDNLFSRCAEPKQEEFDRIILSSSSSEKAILELFSINEKIQELQFSQDSKYRRSRNKIISKLIESNQEEFHLYRSIYLAMENSLLTDDEIKKCNEILIHRVPMDEWSAPNEIVFGRAYILLFVAASYEVKPESNLNEYLKFASERLLRIFEIKQQNILRFKNLPEDKNEALTEQIRLIYLFLRLSQIYNDIRFLNAALKSNDRILPLIKKIQMKGSKSDTNNLSLMYYRLNILLQESQISKIK